MDYATRRKAQAQETQKHILQCALELMAEQGFDQVSVRDICARAKITTGAFYHHYPSKDALLPKGFGALDDFMRARLEAISDATPEERLWTILTLYTQFMERSQDLLARYYQQRLGPGGGNWSLDTTRYTITAMVNCFQDAQTQGTLAPGYTPQWAAEFCFRHFRGLVLDWLIHGFSYPLLPRMEEDFRVFQTFFHVEVQPA